MSNNLNQTPTIHESNSGKVGNAAPAVVLEPGSTFANRFEIKRLIGQGGMGSVYEALDTKRGVDIALKVLHPSLFADAAAMRVLVGEANTAMKIVHPNVIRVNDVSDHDGIAYMSMELLQGQTLRDELDDAFAHRRRMTVEQAVDIAKQMLRGLSAAHQMKVVHRDLKPANIFLAETGASSGAPIVKIVDFGIARASSTATSLTTGSRGSSGTFGLPYMAPEQHSTNSIAQPETDIYAVATMLLEMLLGGLPQKGFESASRDRPDVPKALDDVIDKGMRTSPLSRFHSADAFIAALDAAMDMPGTPSTDQSGKRPPSATWGKWVDKLVDGTTEAVGQLQDVGNRIKAGLQKREMGNATPPPIVPSAQMFVSGTTLDPSLKPPPIKPRAPQPVMPDLARSEELAPTVVVPPDAPSPAAEAGAGTQLQSETIAASSVSEPVSEPKAQTSVDVGVPANAPKIEQQTPPAFTPKPPPIKFKN